MVNHFEPLCAATQQGHKKPISRAQLPLLLAKVNGTLFAKLLFEWLGWTLDADQKRWFALDGKELRGSIEPGQKRGEVCVSALVHDSQEIAGQLYYSGTKESECPTVRQLLNEAGLYDQKITLDALHRTDFHGLCKRRRIIFVIVLAPVYYRTDPMYQLIANRI